MSDVTAQFFRHKKPLICNHVNQRKENDFIQDGIQEGYHKKYIMF